MAVPDENVEDAIASRKQAEIDYGVSDLCYKKEEIE